VLLRLLNSGVIDAVLSRRGAEEVLLRLLKSDEVLQRRGAEDALPLRVEDRLFLLGCSGAVLEDVLPLRNADDALPLLVDDMLPLRQDVV
jgi:hypothetical protein